MNRFGLSLVVGSSNNGIRISVMSCRLSLCFSMGFQHDTTATLTGVKDTRDQGAKKQEERARTRKRKKPSLFLLVVSGVS